jgi:hypothetical protein
MTSRAGLRINPATLIPRSKSGCSRELERKILIETELRCAFCHTVINWYLRPLEQIAMETEGFIEGTAQEVMARLTHVPPGQRVRLMVGRPSLSVIARRLQATAAANGMTDKIHDDLLKSLNNG